MSKQAVSVTLERANLAWLRAQARSLKRRSLSDMLDLLVAEARARGLSAPDAPRSVVGQVEIDEADPDLAGADAAIRPLFHPNDVRPKRDSGSRKAAARRG